MDMSGGGIAAFVLAFMGRSSKYFSRLFRPVLQTWNQMGLSQEVLIKWVYKPATEHVLWSQGMLFKIQTTSFRDALSFSVARINKLHGYLTNKHGTCCWLVSMKHTLILSMLISILRILSTLLSSGGGWCSTISFGLVSEGGTPSQPSHRPLSICGNAPHLFRRSFRPVLTTGIRPVSASLRNCIAFTMMPNMSCIFIESTYWSALLRRECPLSSLASSSLICCSIYSRICT